MAATSVDVMDATGAKVGTAELPADLFDVETNIPLIHQVVVAQRAAARQGTHSTKTRGEVSGGGKKPYKQKGTGRARQGSIRAPQFTGGGVVHGPQPRSYDQRTPKKMKAAALRGVLSDRARHGRVHVIDSFGIEGKPKTRAAVETLARISDRRHILVVVERTDDLAMLSLRNIEQVHLLVVDQLNTYDVVVSDDVLFTRGALDAYIAVAPRGHAAEADEFVADVVPVAKAATAKAKAPKAEAPQKADAESAKPATLVAAVPDEYPGSAQPLENGDGPEGYPVKGNKDSMKFHQPGGRWYDATIAEVWFRTAADAEAAGFVEAGSKSKAAEEDEK